MDLRVVDGSTMGDTWNAMPLHKRHNSSMGHAKLLYYLIGSIVILAVEIDSDVGESLVDVLFLIKDISALIDLGDVELLNPVVDHCLAYVELLHELSQIVIVLVVCF